MSLPSTTPKPFVGEGETLPAAAASTSVQLQNEGPNDIYQDVATSFIPFNASLGQEFIGNVIGGSDWCHFYLRPDGFEIELLSSINEAMNLFYESDNLLPLKQLGLWAPGIPCAVRYAKDQKWYRARLEDPAYNMVRFVDYGNVQACADDDIKPLLKIFVETCPITALPCTLTDAQDNALPSFASEEDKVIITLLSPVEPYEVAVKLVTSEAKRKNVIPSSEAASTAISSALPRGLPRFRQLQRPTNTEGLSMMPSRSSSMPGMEDDSDDWKGAKASASAANIQALPPSRPRRESAQSQQRQYSITNGVGTLCDLFATCGVIVLSKYPARRSEMNTQQSSFCGGPLLIEDLRRIFRAGECVRFSARYEQPYVSQDMEWSLMVADDYDPDRKKQKYSEQQALNTGRWLVTDFRPFIDDNQLLIIHAVVTFVGDTACSLYVRGTTDTVWAPKGTFPELIACSPRPLRDLLDIGRSVIVRAEPAECFPDFRIKAKWVAKAVEFVGPMHEEKGTMYLVRDNYSVIITEGNVGFGYAFVANQFVDAAGLPMNEWYGTRVYFRSCADVPDRDEARFGIRMKALRAQLSPEETKGYYRYAGIYRPSSVSSYDDLMTKEKEKSKKLVDDDAMDLPPEALQEMRILGQDTIGIEAPHVFPVPEGMKMVRENLRNEIRDETLHTSMDAGDFNLIPVEEASTVEITISEVPDFQFYLPPVLPPPLIPLPDDEPSFEARELKTVDCQTGIIYNKTEEEQCRNEALEELHRMVDQDDDVVKWMKFTKNFPKDSLVRGRIYKLLGEALAMKRE